ncbi:hypothetical protein D3C84_467580 [compost metagenome]
MQVVQRQIVVQHGALVVRRPVGHGLIVGEQAARLGQPLAQAVPGLIVFPGEPAVGGGKALLADRILTRQPGDAPFLKLIQHIGVVPRGRFPHLRQGLGGMTQQQLVAQGHHLIGIGDEEILPAGGAASQQQTGQQQAGQ